MAHQGAGSQDKSRAATQQQLLLLYSALIQIVTISGNELQRDRVLPTRFKTSWNWFASFSLRRCRNNAPRCICSCNCCSCSCCKLRSELVLLGLLLLLQLLSLLLLLLL